MNRNDHSDRVTGRGFRKARRMGAVIAPRFTTLPTLDPKSKWAKFGAGKSVTVSHRRGVENINLKIAEVRPDGLLLKGRNLLPFEPDERLTVDGEKCAVVRVSSKGLYVRAAR